MDITEAEFKALEAEYGPSEYSVEGEYGYDTLTDADGNEIAFASYHSVKPTTYTKVTA